MRVHVCICVRVFVSTYVCVCVCVWLTVVCVYACVWKSVRAGTWPLCLCRRSDNERGVKWKEGRCSNHVYPMADTLNTLFIPIPGISKIVLKWCNKFRLRWASPLRALVCLFHELCLCYYIYPNTRKCNDRTIQCPVRKVNFILYIAVPWCCAYLLTIHLELIDGHWQTKRTYKRISRDAARALPPDYN